MRRVICFLFVVGCSSAFGAQISIVDDLNRMVVLQSPATRIVSLAPSITETLFAIGAGDQLTGVTNYCNYPAEVATKHRVGGIINPSIETIVALKPDLILLSMEGNVREDFAALTGFGVPVFVTNPRTLEGIYRSINQIGILTGKKENAVRLVSSLRMRADSLTRIATRKPRSTAMVFVSVQPIIVVGKNTFLAELVQNAGGIILPRNAATTYPMYSREAVLTDNPDVLIFMSDVLVDPAELLKLFPEWSKLKAFRRKKIFRIDADLVARPGPRAILGMESLYNLIH